MTIADTDIVSVYASIIIYASTQGTETAMSAFT